MAILAIIIIAGGVGFQVVRSQPGFCNSCHEMNFYYQSWQSSTHATKGVCVDCHSEPGLQGFIGENVRGARQLVAHFSGNYKVPIQIVTRVKNGQCLACHPETRNLTDKTIEAKHNLHMDKSVLCADCHNRLVHNKSEQPRVMALSQCDSCHKAHSNFKFIGVHATLSCEKCHPGDKYNGINPNCESCHKVPAHAGMDTDCAQCHSRDGFTPANFVHNRVGEHIGTRAERPLSCITCHPVRFMETTCTGSRCHSSNNPQGEGDD